MKCFACGYEYEIDYKGGIGEITKGNEEFILMDEHFHKEYNDFPYNRECSIWACPKCGTLKIDVS